MCSSTHRMAGRCSSHVAKGSEMSSRRGCLKASSPPAVCSEPQDRWTSRTCFGGRKGSILIDLMGDGLGWRRLAATS
jgi:hypothetical protein